MLLTSTIAAIEFDGDEVRVAQVRAGGKQPVLDAVHAVTAVYAEPDERFDAMVKAIDSALDALGGTPACYVVCLSSAQTIARNLTIPFRGARRVAASVRFELEPYLALPIDELAIDFTTVGEFDGETEVLAIAARNSQIAEAQALLEAAGARLDAITVDVVALTGLWSIAQPLRGLQAVLHLRRGHACLAVTYNKRMAFFRHLPFSSEMVETNPDAFAREVANTLRAFASKWRGKEAVELLHVTGVQLASDEAAALQQSIGVPVESSTMITSIPGAAVALAEGPSGHKLNRWEAVLGAAHGSTGRGFGVNLIGEQQDVNPFIRDATRHVVFSGVLLALVLGGWALYYWQAANQYREEAATLRAQQETVQMEALDSMEEGLPDDIDTTVFTDPTLLEILTILGRRLPEDQITLHNIRVSPPGNRLPWIIVEGEVGNSGQLQEIFAGLKTEPRFRFESDPEVRVEGSTTTFAIKIMRPEPGVS